MRLVSYNIQYGFGVDGRYDLERIARVVHGADIIALQEVERFWKRSGEDDQPALLGRLLPGYFWVYGPAFDMDASFRNPAGEIVNRRRQFGTMLLSKLPIVWSRLHLLPMRRTLRPLNTQNAALECLVETPGGPVRFWSIHLAHIAAEERLDAIGLLLAQHAAAPMRGGPWTGADDEPARNWTNGEAEPASPLAAVMMGDFNCEPGSEEYLRIVGRNPYHPDAAYLAGFADAVVLAGHAPGTLYTHVKQIAGTMRRRQLDHCFVSAALAERVRSASVDNDQIASDHHPVFVDFDLVSPGRATATW